MNFKRITSEEDFRENLFPPGPKFISIVNGITIYYDSLMEDNKMIFSRKDGQLVNFVVCNPKLGKNIEKLIENLEKNKNNS